VRLASNLGGSVEKLEKVAKIRIVDQLPVIDSTSIFDQGSKSTI